MPIFGDHPRAAAAVESLVVLALSYVAARLAALLLARILARHRAAPDVRYHLAEALDGPVTSALFLVGALRLRADAADCAL